MKHGIWKDHNVSELHMESNFKLINLIKAISVLVTCFFFRLHKLVHNHLLLTTDKE